MGEVAEMMLDGTLCQSCGEYLDQEPVGYPVSCGGCAGFNDAEVVIHVELDAKPPKTVHCPEFPKCERMFRTRWAAAQHWAAKHE